MKSTVDQIRERFDHDVERFTNLETGQEATIDAPLVMDLLTEAASVVTPHATHVLDIGCGAGNYTLKLLQRSPNLDVTLLDLSKPMLDRAVERVSPKTTGRVIAVQGDVRDIDLGQERYDVVMTAAALHHLRDESQWRDVFTRVYQSLRSGGSFWISDLIEHSHSIVQQLIWKRYGAYLESLGGDAYREKVFQYIEKEDTPRPLVWQLDVLRSVGFSCVEVLHKNICGAAFGAIKE